MSMSWRARTRAALGATGALALALLTAPQALAAGGTPTTPTDLFNGYSVCSNDPDAPTWVWGGAGVILEGVPGYSDAQGPPSLSEQFRLWPAADPTQVTSLTHEFANAGFEGEVTAPADSLTDGQVYAWQAQTVAGTDASEWSAPCYFAVDDTSPSTAPTVTSANYPQDQTDQGGDPVRFTFDANGVEDVGGFEFSWQTLPVIGGADIGEHGIPQPVDPYADTSFVVRADSPGGSATVDLIPPGTFGPVTLHVVSLDRALNRSFSEAAYSFHISSAAPTVTPAGTPRFDRPATFRLTPNPQLQAKSPAVSYTVQTLDGQHDRTVQVPAAPDGTARVTLTLDGVYDEYVLVSSTSANGWVSDQAWWSASFDTAPTVNSDVYPENAASGGAGTPATFTFTPTVPHVVNYTYSFNGGAPVTVKAGVGHAGRITWTPGASGPEDLRVYATTRDGIQLASRDYYFSVN